jgi:hypothetical protein
MNPWLDGVIALVPAVMVPLWVAARGSTANRVVAVQFATVLTCLSGCSGRGGCKRLSSLGMVSSSSGSTRPRCIAVLSRARPGAGCGACRERAERSNAETRPISYV